MERSFLLSGFSLATYVTASLNESFPASVPYVLCVIVAIFKEALARDHRGFREGTRESSSMRTSKNRSSRARYTCAGRATGRSGWIAVLLCFVSLPFALFCPRLSRCHPLFTSRLIPLALTLSTPRPFLSVSAAAAHSRELLFGCFITFINAAATMLPLTPSRIGAAGVSFVGLHHAPLLLAERCEF